MANTLTYNSTQLTVIGTEHTLRTETGNGQFQLTLDLQPMVLGDVMEVRIYKTINSVERVVWSIGYNHNQGEFIKEFPPIASTVSCRFTIKQTAGTVHTYAATVTQLG